MVEALERHGELEMREALLSVSASTIDRLLREERRKMQLKGRARTRPGTLLKHQIPVRSFSDREEGRAGFVEMDRVAHDGGRAKEDYAQTLDLTDVATGWIELQAVLNKAPLPSLPQERQLLRGAEELPGGAAVRGLPAPPRS